MSTRNIYSMIIVLLTSALLISSLFISTSLAQEISETDKEKIEEMIAMFASEPELAMKQLEELAEENPELAVLTLVELAKEIPEKAVMAIVNLAEINPSVTARGLVAIGQLSIGIVETEPKLAAILKAILSQSIVQMVESGSARGLGVAAVVVQSFKQSNPELGESLEEEAVAAGLERSYLLAASPIMP